MIFVTVGTHEQSFDRLVKYMDKMVENGIIKEEVIIQKGYTNYEPIHCKSYKLLGYDEMQKYIKKARIIVTHGGPASFINPLTIGKIPIVVPREKKFNEHVNDHQVDFVKQVVLKNKFLIPIYEINDLEEKILNYEKIIAEMGDGYISNNKTFIDNLEREVKQMFYKNEYKNQKV